MWERACPRFSGGPVTLFDDRYTAIAGKPAPTFDGWCGQNAVPGQDPLWERACPRFSGGPVTLIDDRYTAIAGKSAPTFDGWCGQNAVPGQDPLWERACPRFSGGPVTLFDARYTAIAGKPAPTGSIRDRQVQALLHLFHHDIALGLAYMGQLEQDVAQQFAVRSHLGNPRLHQVVEIP